MACGALTRDVEVNRRAALITEFQDRIDRYMELREEAVEVVPDAEPTRDPADIRARENALAARIRALRATAKHGDIFTPEIRGLFRRLVSPQLKGDRGEEIRDSLQEDAPAPGAVPLEVNAKYPAGLPFPTTPPTLLSALPRLPRGLEYRIIGNDLVLLDQPADVIIDYIRNIIPAATT
jgi:hypothetical protein